MKAGVLEMKATNKDNSQSTIFNFFKPKAGNGEENQPTAAVTPFTPELPKPSRIQEDLDPTLLTKSLELPALSKVPVVNDALSVQDNMKLWTILGFLEDHAKDYLGSDMAVPDLGDLRDMVLNCKQRFMELLVIYEALYHGIKSPFGKKESIENLVIPEVIARYFFTEGDEKWGKLLSSTEFVDLHPHSHIDIMGDLVDAILDTNTFREHVSGIDDIVARLKSKKEKMQSLKESSLLNIKELDSKIAEISAEMDSLDSIEDVIDLDEEEFIVRSRSKRRRDAEEESKRLENINNLKRKKELLESKLGNLKDIIKDAEEYLKAEKPYKVTAESRLRGNTTRLVGSDRNGRLYWRVPISKLGKSEGLLIESVIYLIYENDTEIVEEKPSPQKNVPRRKKVKREDDSSDLSSYNPSDREIASADESSDIVLEPSISTVRLDLKSVFEFIDSYSTLIDLQNALNINGLRENSLKVAIKDFISENQDSLFVDEKDMFLTSFIAWILSSGHPKQDIQKSLDPYKEAALKSMHQILPYILVGLNLEVPDILPSNLNECLASCELLQGTQFNRNRVLYKELTSIKTYSAMIHWLQRAESYVAYLIKKEEIEEMRQERREARQSSSITSGQTSSHRNSGSLSSEISRQELKKGKSGKAKKRKSDNIRRSGRNTDRKDYTIKLVVTSSDETSEDDEESDSRDKRRWRLRKKRNIESSDSNSSSSEDDLLVGYGTNNA